VPEILDSARYPRLGAWVQAQRRARRTTRNTTQDDQGMISGNRRISSVQIAKLDRIGFEWGSVKQSGWDAKFALLQQYVMEHGNARVPRSLDTPQYPKLGNWVSHQRQAYRNQKLRAAGREPRQTQVISSAQIAKMESLGFEWSGLRKWDWDAKYALLREFKAEHGHVNVPQSLDSEQYPKLGSWVLAQRQAFRSEQIRKRRMKQHAAKAASNFGGEERDGTAQNSAGEADQSAADFDANIATATPVTTTDDIVGITVSSMDSISGMESAGVPTVKAVPLDEPVDSEDAAFSEAGGTTSSRLSALQIAKLKNIGFRFEGAKLQAWHDNCKLLQVRMWQCMFVFVCRWACHHVLQNTPRTSRTTC